MEIGINLFCYDTIETLGIDAQIELMKKYGFKHTFAMSDNVNVDKELVEKLKTASIVLDTLHAPFKKINDMWFQGEAGEEMLASLINGVEKCAKFGIPVFVVHLSAGIPAPIISDIGNARFGRLMDAARKNNVTIAYENQRYLANIALAFEQYPEARFCWDIGHEGCFTPGRQYMPLFGDRLVALHVQDNHQEYNRDEHLLPYNGTVDYERAAQQIAQRGFEGTIMLEVIRNASAYYQNIQPDEYYKRAAESAVKFASRVAEIKQGCEVM